MQVSRAPGWHIVFATAGLYNLFINRDWIGTMICAVLLGVYLLRKRLALA